MIRPGCAAVFPAAARPDGRAAAGAPRGIEENVMDWHPSYEDLVAAVSCPQCGAPVGQWCTEDPERDLHIDRILLARGMS